MYGRALGDQLVKATVSLYGAGTPSLNT